MNTKKSLAGPILWVVLAVMCLNVPRGLAHALRIAHPAWPEQSAVAAREVALTVDAAKSKANITLGSTLHTVHGSFAIKRGSLHLEPDGKASGEIIADATTGQTGDSGRDKKMHKDVLESPKFSDIVFRPDRVEGKFPATGAVSVQMHGKFSLHGSEHEMTIPVSGEIDGDNWHATAKFKIPYVDWGLKSPNTFILKADPVVEVELELAGTLDNH